MDRLIIDYLPGVLKEVREVKAITDTEQTEIDQLWSSVNDAMNDQFISTATEIGVSRWEKILNITPKATETLSDRKFRLLTKLNAQLPYTFRRLGELLRSLCGEGGYSMTLQSEIYTLTVKVQLVAKNNFADVGVLLNQICPANMIVDLMLMYNQYSTLAGFTHAQLEAYTHDQLRNEVIS